MKEKLIVGVTKEPKTDIRLTAEDMTPVRLNLYKGQNISVLFTDEEGNKKKGFVQIRKLYKHHALCKVNGRRNECYSYNELSTLAAVRKGL